MADWFWPVVGMNAVAWGAMGFDKFRARSGGWRIPEKRLWLLALLFGASGACLGMWSFRHKTRHFAFRYGLPALAAAQLAALGYWGH